MLTLLKSLFKANLSIIRLKSKRRRKKRIIFPKRRRRGGRRYQRAALLPDIQGHLEQIRKNSWQKMSFLRDNQIKARVRRIPVALKGRAYELAQRRIQAGVTKYLIDRYSKKIRRLNKRRYKFAFGSRNRFPFRTHDEIKFANVYPRLRDRSKRFKLARYNFFKISLRPLLMGPVLVQAEAKADKDSFFEIPQVKRKIRSFQRRYQRSQAVYNAYLGMRSLVRWSNYEKYKPFLKAQILPALNRVISLVQRKRRYRKFVWSRFLQFLSPAENKDILLKRGNSQIPMTTYQQAYYNLRKIKPVQRRMLFRRRKRLIRLINYFGFTTSRVGRWFRPRRLYIRPGVFKRYRMLVYNPLIRRLKSKRIRHPYYRYNYDIPKFEFRLRFRRRMPFSEGHRPDKLRRTQTVTHFRKFRARRWRAWNLRRRVRKFRLIRRRYKIIGRYNELQRGDLNVLPKINVPIVELRETANNFYIVVKRDNQTLFDRTCGMVYPHGAPKFEGPKRRTTYAAEVLGKHVGRILLMKQMPHIRLKLRTRPNEKVKAAIKGIKSVEIPVKFAAVYKEGRLVRASFHGVRRVHVDRVSINVPLSHNGLRKRKPRRI
jgi:ribosomal protein S11